MSLPSPSAIRDHLPLPSKRTVSALMDLPRARTVPQALDAAMQVSAESVDKAIAKLLEGKGDDVTVAELQEQATSHYVSRASLLSGLVGAGAAFPGVGTAAAAGLTVADLASFYANTTTYVLVMAKLQGLSTTDPERQRMLVLTSLLGEEGTKMVTSQFGLQTLLSARKQMTAMSGPTVKALNKKLLKYASKKAAQKSAKRALGRFIPFGVGAAFGYFSGRRVANEVVEGLRASLGAPRQATVATLRAELA